MKIVDVKVYNKGSRKFMKLTPRLEGNALLRFIHHFEGEASRKLIYRLGWVTVIFTYFLVSLGGTVRANNAGLGCPDWPLCYGRAFVMPDISALLEESHRYVASIVSVLVIALALSIFLWARQNKTLVIMAIVALVILAIQIVLGGLTVLLKLEGAIIMSHLGTAELLFATVIIMTLMMSGSRPDSSQPTKTRKFARLAVVNAVLVYGLLLSGSYVFNTGSSLACPGWPLCGAAPAWAVQYHMSDINMLHRYIGMIVGLVIIWTLVSAWLRRKVAPVQAWVAVAAGLIFIVQSGVGALIVLYNKPIVVAVIHLALATAVWGSMVILATLAVRQMLATPKTIEGH